MKLPKRNRDLARYALKKDIRRGILYALWLVAWVVAAYAYNANHQTYPPERLLLGWRLAFWMLGGVTLGFCLFRCWKFFTHRTVRGDVLYSGLSHTYTHSESPGVASSLEYEFRLRTALILRTPSGKKRRLRFEQKIGSYHYYNDGEKLIRFHGLPYPVNLDPDAPHGYVCAACGRMYRNLQEKCDVCELSLIDPKELNIEP